VSEEKAEKEEGSERGRKKEANDGWDVQLGRSHVLLPSPQRKDVERIRRGR